MPYLGGKMRRRRRGPDSARVDRGGCSRGFPRPCLDASSPGSPPARASTGCRRRNALVFALPMQHVNGGCRWTFHSDTGDIEAEL